LSEARGPTTSKKKRLAKKKSQKKRQDKSDKSTPFKTLSKLALMTELKATV